MSYALLFGVMLLMPFVFERAYLDDPLAAGLRLSIIPIAISLLAPVSGILYDRLGPRVPTLVGHGRLRGGAWRSCTPRSARRTTVSSRA